MNMVGSSQEFEKYRLTAEAGQGCTLQLVSNRDNGANTWQKWKHKRRLGQGAFGVVWQEAWDDQYGDSHYRAVKSCSEAQMRSDRIDWQRELSALAAFSRSECAGWFVNLHGWWTDSGTVCIAMEYLSRGDLSRYAADGLSEIEIKEIAQDVFQGLAVMHAKGFTHRDIKPQNILVAQKRPEHHRWWVKIADFGISKQTPAGSETALYSSVGTRPYCAPEVLGHLDEYSEVSVYSNKVDMWSMGCVLFNLSSRGQLLFSETSLARYCAGIAKFNAKSLPLNLSNQGRLLIETLVTVDPKQRPTAAEALQHPWLTASHLIPTNDNVKLVQKSQSESKQNYNSFMDSERFSDPSLHSTTLNLTIRPIKAVYARNTSGPNGVARKTSTTTVQQSDERQRSPPMSQPAATDLAPETVKGKAVKNPSVGGPVTPGNEALESPPGRTSAGVSESKKRIMTISPTLAKLKLPQETFLHVAVREGDLNEVKVWARQPEGLDARDNNGWTPLHHTGRLEVVKWLVREGADINATNRSGGNLLHSAASRGRLKVAEWLLERGFDMNARDDHGKTPLHYAACYGYVDFIKQSVKWGADIHVKDQEDVTPLQRAAASGYLEVVKFLVELGVDIHKKDQQGVTPLNEASADGHLEIVRFLVERGADINVTDRNGASLLHTVAWRGHVKIAAWLLDQGLDVVAKDKHGWTPLAHACYENRLEVAELLVNRGDRVITMGNSGMTLLHVVVKGDRPEVGAWLLQQGCGIDATDQYGETPLFQACYFGGLKMVKWLVNQGADVNTVDGYGRTLLHIAATRGHLEVTKWLVRQGIGVNASAARNAPLHCAIRYRHLALAEYLVEQNYSLTARDYKRKTPLDYAHESDLPTILAWSTKQKADIDLKNGSR